MDSEVDVGHNRGAQRYVRRRAGGLRRVAGQQIAALAACQHGAVAHRQLADLGLSRRQIAYLIRSGHLHPVHRGVYAVGHARLTREGGWMAAVLAGGPDAALSHWPAAMHWRLLAPFTSLPHLTTPRRRRKRSGIRHHTAVLPEDEVTIRDGIPVTTVARTIFDLASCSNRHRVERAIAEAEYRRYADSPSLGDLIERYPGRRGVRVLRDILTSGDARAGVTRSRLEERFLRFLDSRGLERPELNAPLQLGETHVVVDCMWRRQRIAVELDGRRAHLRAGQWESDRLRDRHLLVADWKPARVTSRQLDTDPDGLEHDLRSLGITAAPRGTSRDGEAGDE